jgi:serralysin
MKLSFLSKAISTLGLVAALSVVVGSGIQRTVQAQAQSPAQPQTEAGAATANLTIAAIVAQSGGEYDNNSQDFDILLNALKETDLVDDFEAAELDVTVFAPTDKAFLKLSRFFGYTGSDESGVLGAISKKFTELNKIEGNNNPGFDPKPYDLRDLILYHLSNGVKTSADLQNLKGGKIVRTLLNEPDGSDVSLRARMLNYVDGKLNDSAINIIDPQLQAGLTDISASNGIIHGIDRVLMPYFLVPTSPETKAQAGQPATLADVIAQSGEFDDNDQDFDILFKLLQTAELTDALADPNADLTLFAPTDAAFLKLQKVTQGTDPAGEYVYTETDTYRYIVDYVTMLDPTVSTAPFFADAGPNIRLLPSGPEGSVVALWQKVLKYHVSTGAKTAAEIQAAPAISTLLEDSAITPKDGKLVDLSPEYADPQLQAGKTDITASNGVIQVIDNVLIPRFVFRYD